VKTFAKLNGYYGPRATEQGDGHALANLTCAIFDLHADQLKDHALFSKRSICAAIEDNRNERLDSADGSVPLSYGSCSLPGSNHQVSGFWNINLVAQALMTAALAASLRWRLCRRWSLTPFTGQVVLTSLMRHCSKCPRI
jgi:hypothetical protein